MSTREFLDSIDINTIEVISKKEVDCLNRVIRENDNLLDDNLKEDRIKYAKLAIYLYNTLPYGIIKNIVELNK